MDAAYAAQRQLQDKLLAAATLHRAGIPFPSSLASARPAQLAPRVAATPLILKAHRGYHGAGITVVETPEFLRRAKPLLSESERAHLVAFIGANPEAGEIIPETGGVRKIRWALPGMGKRGGARVIYYYHNQHLPIFLLSAYAWSRKENLSKGERNEMKRLVPALIAGYPRKA